MRINRAGKRGKMFRAPKTEIAGQVASEHEVTWQFTEPQPEQIRLYYPKLDSLVDHGKYDLLSELKLLALMSNYIILPPSHLAYTDYVTNALSKDSEFLGLLETDAFLTSIHEDHKDTDDLLAELRIDSRELSKLLHRIRWEHRVTYTQSRVFRHVFREGLLDSKLLQERLMAASASPRIGMKLADCLYDMGSGTKIALTRNNLNTWYRKNVSVETYRILKRYSDYCYYYAGAVGNNATVVHSPFFHDVELMPASGFYGHNPAYDAQLFRFFLNELGIENDTIRNLSTSDIKAIRSSPAHNDFVWLYYRLAKEAEKNSEELLLILREYHACHELSFKTIVGQRLTRIGILAGAISGAGAVMLRETKWLTCLLVAFAALCTNISNWKQPQKPNCVQHIIDTVYHARWPMSILIDKLISYQTRRHVKAQ